MSLTIHAGRPANRTTVWCVSVLEDQRHPWSYAIRECAGYRGRLADAIELAHALSVQRREANRGLWPCWSEVHDADGQLGARVGEVPQELLNRERPALELGGAA